ncbi:pyruvate, phosphate dikinase [Motilimonas cestriensis]|uniref:Pyruvate, phosphate dikinase n=1 Tax=Motilimonas cestriensis TaxID=2742685 RepID=A0ABS8WBF6_9GAMM|nr:PEP-utilizing enzyme [Motilimonas cestriensis]MCE2595583.1 pyruvate, phosphate dikinase [Motilimonas cestriensis]
MQNSPLHFGTKSETLERLIERVDKSKVLPLVYFTEQQWLASPQQCLAKIARLPASKELVVRSSAQNEDGAEHSMAGAFVSVLNVCASDSQALRHAIEQVIDSFRHHPHSQNQVLIQPMLLDIQMSGVVMTHDLQHGAPYYIVNYDDESGLTDTITGGIGIQKTVHIYRNTPLSQLKSPRLIAVIEACKELESAFNHVPLDIEFAVDSQEQVYVLQVRRISLYKTWHPLSERCVERQLGHIKDYLKQRLSPKQGVYGEQGMLANMPDWNPAEIIGTSPNPLASSLYRYLITDETWRVARHNMGYHQPRNEPLMVMLGHQPYVDVRLSFNSFLPANLPSKIGEKLVNAWLARLQQHPQWHDKVEFEIAQTCLDFCSLEEFDSRYQNILSNDEKETYFNTLSALTFKCIQGRGLGTLEHALNEINKIKQQQLKKDPAITVDLSDIKTRLDMAKTGAHFFAILARHAFIAESILRSASRKTVISYDKLQQWKRSIHTISTELTTAYSQVTTGSSSQVSFLKKFGHLRPGTYDITSLRYDERSDLFEHHDAKTIARQAISQHWQPEELSKLQKLLSEKNWPINANQLIEYAVKAIQAREYAKFVFTRDLSDALASLTLWGARVGLSRDNLSFLDIRTIVDSLYAPVLDDADRVWLNLVNQNQQLYQQSAYLKLGHIISHPNDIYVIPQHRAQPNFITANVVEAEVFRLNQHTPVSVELTGKIVCIENADPGYDWIFTKNIAGLITQYGGTNSHMAIRCAEFSIAAAIGCGEQLFQRLNTGGKVSLNCRDKTIVKF